jgi:thymidine kinase
MFLEQFPGNKRTNGWIETICGSMFSGKTEELIRRIKRAEFAQQKVLLVKPILDKRYSDKAVVSHQGTSVNAISLTKSSEILNYLDSHSVLAVDEAQFFDEDLPDICQRIANIGVRVIVAGLDMDFKGQPFGPIPALMAMSEYVTKVHAICVKCGNLAQFSHRISSEDKQVLLGEKDHYEPLCRSCFNQYNK